MNKFCTKCGTQWKEGAKFCASCGAPAEAVKPVADPVMEPVAAPVAATAAVAAPKAPAAVKPAKVKKEKPGKVKKEKTVASNKLQPRGAGRTVLAVFLSILIFLYALGGTVLLNARMAMSPSNMEATAKVAVKAAEDVVVDTDDGEENLLEYYLGEVSMDHSKFVEKSAVVNLLCEKAAYIPSDYLNDEDNAVLDARKLYAAIEKDCDWIELESDYEIMVKDNARDDACIQISTGFENLTNMVDRAEEELPSVLFQGVRYALSWWGIAIAFCVLAVWIVLLAKTNRWNLLRTSMDLGITLAVVGVLGLAASVIVPMLANDFIPELLAFEGDLGDMPKVVLGRVLRPALIGSAITVVVAVLLIVVKPIFSRVCARKKA